MMGNNEYEKGSTDQTIYLRVLNALNHEAERSSKADGYPSRYSSVHVLLLQWEGDDLSVNGEVDALAQVFARDFGFNVELYSIPEEKSLRRLTSTVTEWVELHDHPNNLFILYYAGHGRISDSGRTVIWSNRMTADDHYRELKWTGCEDILHESVSDKLFLYDCCYAAGLATVGEGGVSETICASGFESIAPVPGPHSFTTALTFVLRQMAGLPRPFSISIVYSAVLAYLKELNPAQIAPDGLRIADAQDHAYSLINLDRLEYRRTPVHFVRTHHLQAPDIQLFPLASTQDDIGMSESEAESNDAVPASTLYNRPPGITVKVYPTGDLVAQDAEAARRWLRGIPLPFRNIVIEPDIPRDEVRDIVRSEYPAEKLENRLRELEKALTTMDERGREMDNVTKRDSASMKSIALITVLFLPGTFMSTFLSLNFSDIQYSKQTRSIFYLWVLATGILLFGTLVAYLIVYRKLLGNWRRRDRELQDFVKIKKCS